MSASISDPIYWNIGMGWPGSRQAYDSSAVDILAGNYSFAMDTLPTAIQAVPPAASREMLAVMEANKEIDERGHFALEVEKILGYSVLRKAVAIPGKLHRALDALEIDVYVPATVEAYKEKMRLHHQTELDNEAVKAIQLSNGRVNRPKFCSWRTTELSMYVKPVPEYVLRKCVQIKRAIPEAQFFVEELTTTEDPFMVVRVGEESAYIEVWDEPKFEG